MKSALIDTDILSMFFRNQKNVVNKFREYIDRHSQINISIITYYEIASGLKHRDSQKQYRLFEKFSDQSNIIPLTKKSTDMSAEIYAEMRKKGTPVDDIDLLIAGTALANNMITVTHNRKHFERIPGLCIEDWSVA